MILIFQNTIFYLPESSRSDKGIEIRIPASSISDHSPGKQGYVSGGEADLLTEDRGTFPTHVLLDPVGEIGRLYRATNTPHMYVIDEEGTLVYLGAIDDQPSSRWESVDGASNYVDKALIDVFAGRPVSVPVSRAYGCSIKY